MCRSRSVLSVAAILMGMVAFAQSSVDALGKSSDAAQRVFDGANSDTTPQSGILIDPNRLEDPEFPGGGAAMHVFIRENIIYPKAELEAGIQGNVYVRFILNEKGQVDEVEVARGITPALDSEAVRIVRSMPTWKPGKLDGNVAAARMTIPVRFSIDASNKVKPK